MAKSFHKLTNRGQTRRLRRMALKALEYFDIEVDRLRVINNFYNAIFRVDSQKGAKYVLRIALPENNHNAGKYETEMSWLDALSRETKLSVPKPIATVNDQWSIKVAVEGVPEARYCMLLSWVPGRDLANHINENTLKKWGQLAAILHNHSQKYRPPTGNCLPIFNRVTPPPPFKEPLILFEPQYEQFFPFERRKIYQSAIETAHAALDDISTSGIPKIIVHGDLHQWNIRIYRGRLSPIDFEDLMWSWPVQDIATSLYYLVSHEKYPALRAAYQDGYTTILPWPERYSGELNAFIASRGIGMVNLILQHPNPDWRAQADVYIQKVEKRLQFLIGSND
jgi:Ser/Thr protein kinase RdoA (MazF antagonist)